MKRTAFPRRPSGPPGSAAFPPGPSKPWRATGPRRSSPSATTSPAAWPAAPTLTNPPGWRSSCWACRAWANRACIRRRSLTLGMPKNIMAGGKDHMGTFDNLVGTPAGETRLLKPHRGTPTAWGKQTDSQDPHRRGHQEGHRRLLGYRRPRGADRRPVQEVHLPHPGGPGRHRDPHDVDRHSLPSDLLELRQRCGAEVREPQDRVHRGPASLAGERLPLRGHHPAHQHHPRSGRHLPMPA